MRGHVSVPSFTSPEPVLAAEKSGCGAPVPFGHAPITLALRSLLGHAAPPVYPFSRRAVGREPLTLYAQIELRVDVSLPRGFPSGFPGPQPVHPETPSLSPMARAGEIFSAPPPTIKIHFLRSGG